MPQPKRPLTSQEKERILYQATQGVEISEIAKELNVDVRRVTGYIRTMINAGRLPASPPKNPSAETFMTNPAGPEEARPTPPPVTPVPPSHASVPPPAYVPPSHPPQHAAPAQDGWSGGRPVATMGGYQNTAQQVRVVVERKIPADGIMGEHFGEFSPTQVCETYGAGVYKVLRYEPGKVAMEFEVKASEAYGQPRMPKRASTLDPQNRSSFQRPWGRPWERPSYEREEDDGRPAPARPYPAPVYNRPDPAPYEYARHSSMGDAAASSMASEAIRQMGQAHERTIEQLEKSRTAGPETFMTKLFTDQQALWEKKLAEDERRRTDERKDEEAKWERRQKEVEAENRRRQESAEADSRRRQEEADKAHQRELQRIEADRAAREAAAKEERKMLLDVEDRRLTIMREEHKMREQALQDELKRQRDHARELESRLDKELKEVKETTSSQIEASQMAAEKQREHDRAVLEREFKLKGNAQETELELKKEMLEVRKESLQNQGGDQIFQIINTVVKEFSKGLEKIVDLKKLEAMTPEAQAAAVAKGTIDGNVIAEPRREAPQEAPKAPAHHQQAAAAQAGGGGAQAPKNGNGAGNSASGAPKGETKSEESQMEQIIQDMLDKPFFRQVIKEWSLHVKTNQDPTTFANMYMEWMRDPLDHEGRKATTMFANFMKPRDWTDMMKILGPKLEKEVNQIFRSEAATDFYDGFKAMVVEQIRDYWEQFLAARKAQRAAQTAAGEAPAGAETEAPSQQGDSGK